LHKVSAAEMNSSGGGGNSGGNGGGFTGEVKE